MNNSRENKDFKAFIANLLAEVEGHPTKEILCRKPAAPPNEALLLAYLAGTLSEKEKTQLERQIAASPESLELLHLFIEIYGDDLPPAAPEIIEPTIDMVMDLIAADELKYKKPFRAK